MMESRRTAPAMVHGQAPEEDLYPTRQGTEPRVISRRDPVVYGPEDGQLRPGETAAFERDGFLFLERMFTEEQVRRMREELERMRTDRSLLSREETITEPGSDAVRSIFRVHELSELFGELARDRRLVGIARQILGSDVYLHQSRINYKPEFHGKEFYWHSDFETWHSEDGIPRMRTISIAINLTHNDKFNGPLTVIPGSHRYFISCPDETPERHYERSLRKQEVGIPDAESLKMLVERGGISGHEGPAGTVVVFDCNTMHGSGSNLSPYPRSNLFLVFNSIENTPVAPFCGQPPRPPYVASRDFTPVEPIEPA